MITQVENTEARRYFARFMTQCEAYKTLLTTAGLPVSVDLAQLQAAYRQQLFAGLLKADKGLQARYELLRTDEARQKLVADVINLDGHEAIDTAAAALRQLATTYQQLSIPGEPPLHRNLPLSSFAEYHDLDFGQVLDSYTIDWAGNEHVKAYFDELAQLLTPWLTIVRKTMKSGATMADAALFLPDYFTVSIGGSAGEPVQVNEKVLYHRMQAQKLALHIPKAA